MSAARARELVERGAAWLLDVREGYEWQAGHAPGAHHIPLSALEQRQDELPDDVQLLVICHTGVRSRMVTDALVRAHYPVANVAGGMDAWAAAGGTVIAPDGTPGAVV